MAPHSGHRAPRPGAAGDCLQRPRPTSGLNQDLHLPVDHTGRIGLGRTIRPQLALTRADVEAPTVQRTDRLPAVQRAGSQGSAPMGTKVIEAEELSVEI